MYADVENHWSTVRLVEQVLVEQVPVLGKTGRASTGPKNDW